MVQTVSAIYSFFFVVNNGRLYIFLFYSVANKIKMGKKLEKGLKEKNASAVSQDEENPNKTPGLFW